jgi:SAM-dependent methyltransferase
MTGRTPIGHVTRWLAHPFTRGFEVDDPRLTLIRRHLVRHKSFLRQIYQEWYAAVIKACPVGEGPVLELGSGGGFLDECVPGLITSELQVCPHVRVVLDGQALPLVDGSLRAIVMIDVLHHLPESRRFLREAARCVRHGGRVVMIEPWVSRWSSFVYSRWHHEPFEPEAERWEFPRGGPLSAANTALPWIIFVRDRRQFERECPEWRVVSIRSFMPFRYLIAGGVSMRGLMPGWTFGLWRAVEEVLAPWNERLGMFAQIVLERTDVEREPERKCG